MGSSGRVEVWRGGCRPSISVAAPFVWRCLTGSTLAPFPHLAHRTGHADLPHLKPATPRGGDRSTAGREGPSARHDDVGRGDRCQPRECRCDVYERSCASNTSVVPPSALDRLAAAELGWPDMRLHSPIWKGPHFCTEPHDL